MSAKREQSHMYLCVFNYCEQNERMKDKEKISRYLSSGLNNGS